MFSTSKVFTLVMKSYSNELSLDVKSYLNELSLDMNTYSNVKDYNNSSSNVFFCSPNLT